MTLFRRLILIILLLFSFQWCLRADISLPSFKHASGDNPADLTNIHLSGDAKIGFFSGEHLEDCDLLQNTAFKDLAESFNVSQLRTEPNTHETVVYIPNPDTDYYSRLTNEDRKYATAVYSVDGYYLEGPHAGSASNKKMHTRDQSCFFALRLTSP